MERLQPDRPWLYTGHYVHFALAGNMGVATYIGLLCHGVPGWPIAHSVKKPI